MEQDIALRTMMLTVKYEELIPIEFQGFIKKYLTYMYVVGYDQGRISAFAEFDRKKTAVIQRDQYGNRIAQYESVKHASKATCVCLDVIWRALKTHKLTKNGYYWERVA